MQLALPIIKTKTMAAKKAENPKKVQTFRSTELLIKRAKAKAAKQKTTLSEKVNELVTEWVQK